MTSLPKSVSEQPTSKTSVYRQGHLVYDGATGQYVGDAESTLGPRHGVGPGASLNEMLKWSIENSDPAELARRADDPTVRPPSQVDREILDMLLGEPIVAKMRSCLGKLESSELRSLEGLDSACAALEELEYYAEDIDHSLDLVKIGGVVALRRCCAFGLLDAAAAGDGLAADEVAAEAKLAAEAPEDAAALREAACGVLAAAMQNNPKVFRAASAHGVQTLLLALLSSSGTGGGGGGGGEDDATAKRVGGVAVIRKALLALSAMLRTCLEDTGEAAEAPKERSIDLTAAAAAAAPTDVTDAASAAAAAVPEDLQAAKMAAVDAALPTLCRLSAHPDLKTRRRAIFLLASLAAAYPPAGAAIAAVAAASVAGAGGGGGGGAGPGASAAPSPLLDGVMRGLQDPDEDLRTQSARLLLAVRASSALPGGDAEGAAALARRLAGAGGGALLREVLQRATEAAQGGEEGADPEEPGRLTELLSWVDKAA